MESSFQVSHFEDLRDRLLVKYREFLKASRTGTADGVDPDTGELDGKYRFAGYTAIGSAYAPDDGILFVSLDLVYCPINNLYNDERVHSKEYAHASRSPRRAHRPFR